MSQEEEITKLRNEAEEAKRIIVQKEQELARMREHERVRLETAQQLATLNGETSQGPSNRRNEITGPQIRTFHNNTIAVKLTGRNYSAWKFSVKKALISRQLTTVVYETNSNLNRTEFERKDAEASELLTNSLEAPIVNKIILCESAREIWDRLKLIYEQEGDSNLETSIIMWSNMKQGNLETIADYIARYDEIVDRVTSLGEVLSERLKRAILVGGLNMKFDGFKRVWNQTTDKTYKKLIEMLFQDEAQINHNQTPKGVALFSKQTHSRPTRTFNSTKLKPEKKLLSKEDFQQLLEKSTCRNCGNKGHWAKYCKERNRNSGNNNDDKETEKNAKPNQSKIAFMVKFDKTERTAWYADSASSAHVAHDLNYFASYTPLDEGLTVTTGDNEELPIIGTGSILFKSITSNGEVLEVEVNNVFHVPDIAANLLSVGQSMRNGVRVIFQKQECLFMKDNVEVMHGDLTRNDLIQLNINPVIKRVMLLKEKRTKNEWHEALAHVDMKQIENMARKGVVGGLKLTGTEAVACTDCPGGKAIHASHPSVSRERAELPGEKVHMDLVGPCTPTSLGGAKYFLLMTDEATNYKVIYCLQNKSGDEIADKLTDYFALVESQTGHRVKRLHSDQGSEFINARVKTLLAIEHATISTSSAYTPQQNGLAERANRVVIEATRTMLNACNLTHELWAEAASTAVYLLNRTTTRSHSERTPFEEWTNRKPDLRHVHKFGKETQILATSRQNTKWSPKTVDAYLVGFTERSNTYRVFVPETKEIRICCDVIFVGHKKNETPMDNVHNETEVWEVQIDEKSDDQNQDDSYITDYEHSECSHDKNENKDTNTNQQSIEQTLDDEGIDDNQTSTINQETHDTTKSIEKPISRFERLIDHNMRVRQNNRSNVQKSVCNDNDPQVNSPLETSTDLNLATEIEVAETNDETTDRSMNDTSMLPNTSFFESSRQLKNADTHLNKKAKSGVAGFFRLYYTNVEPKTLQEALDSHDSEHWRQAIKDELSSINDNNTWEIVPRPKDKDVLTTRWVFKIKFLKDGNIDKYKARLVARGYEQREGIDFFETYAAVARYETIRLFLAVTVLMKLNVLQFDIKTAFLNGDLDEDIYIEPPCGVKCESNHVLKLKKALYGLKQAPFCWKRKLDQILADMGMTPTKSDPCLYSGSFCGNYMLVIIYVDDGLIATKSEQVAENFATTLGKLIDVKIIKTNFFVGYEIERHQGRINIHQRSYIESVLAQYNMTNCTPRKTPLNDVDELKKINEEDTITNAPYRQLVGCLNYLSCVSRPDITYAVHELSRYNQKPLEKHWCAAKDVLRYLRGTINMSLEYVESTSLQLSVYSDSDWAGDKLTRKSISGVIMYLAGGAVVYRSKQQSIVALSSTEAEYLAASLAARELIWVSNLLEEIKFEKRTPLLLLDNQATINLIKTDNFSNRSKHIDVIYHHLKDSYKKGKFTLEYINTQDQRADILTKSLGPAKHSGTLSSSMAQSNNTFGIEDLVIWNKTPIRHIKGHIDLGLELVFMDPCNALFSNLTSIPRIDNRIQAICTRRFTSSITDELNKVCETKKRLKERDAGISTAIAAVSAIVLSVHRLYSETQINNDRHELRVVKQLTIELEEMMSKMKQAIVISNSKIDRKLNDLEKDINFLGELVAVQPEINDVLFQTLAHFDQVKNILRSLKGKLVSGSGVPIELLELFDIQNEATPSTLTHSVLNNCIVVNKNHVRLEVSLLKYSENIDILRADPFFYWSVNSDDMCKYIYRGPEFVLYNKTANCIKQVMNEDVINDILLGAGCKSRQIIQDIRQYEAETCVKMTSQNPIIPKVQIKQQGNLVFINCQGHNIVIEGKQQTCPNNIFSLQKSQEWSVDHYSWTYETSNITQPTIDYTIPTKINLMLGTSNIAFQSLTAEELSELTNEESDMNRQKLKESLIRGPSNFSKIGKLTVSFIDMIGEYVAVILLLFLIGLFIKGRVSRRSTTATSLVATVLILQGVFASSKLLEMKSSREEETTEIKKHQQYMKDKWCEDWKYTAEWKDHYDERGYYPETMACALSYMKYECLCDPTSEWIPIKNHDQARELPDYELEVCPENAWNNDSSPISEMLNTATEYLCTRSKHDTWPKERLGMLVASGCILAKRMFNCGCVNQIDHKYIIQDTMTSTATWKVIRSIEKMKDTCIKEKEEKKNRTSLFDKFQSMKPLA